MMKHIIIGVCGSVAAVRVPELVREFRRKGFRITCIMSQASMNIIHPDVLEWASENSVISELTGKAEHVTLIKDASLLLICPATANTISKIANGIADTVVTTFACSALGSGIPIIIVPAMHSSLYKNPFLLENMEKLSKAGVGFLKPRMGEGKAKISSNEDILKKVMKKLR